MLLSHVNGTMLKTKKFTRASTPEMKVIARHPDSVHETVINAAFFFHMRYNLLSTFGQVAKLILSNIMKAKGKIIISIISKLMKKWIVCQ